MNQEFERIFDDLRVKQLAGVHTLCPRCGLDKMKGKMNCNALSRHVRDMFICDDCGTAEALLDFMKNPLPIAEWAIFHPERPAGDFKATAGEDAWKEIQAEQAPFLIRLFKRWEKELPDADFTPYRYEAQKMCKGLAQIWERPFHVTYEVADGTLMLRLQREEDGVQVTCDMIRKDGNV